ncbi:hypothetical protein [Archangium sp.]|uniref:hypothetical protein n=1 Tax=Archangium sp. TaxID=1872627 RepID=UPI00286C7423|nr:hypothetical protein [Archangium sp.]
MARPKQPRAAKASSTRALARMAAKTPADEDLVIFAPDHQFYWVAKEEYRKHPFEVEEGDLYDHLLRAGVVLAQLPPKREDLPPELGDARCICYLVNLASIHAQAEQKSVPRSKPASPTGPASRTASVRKSSRAGGKRK